MEINYEGKISKNEYLKALLLHNRQLKFQKWLFGIIFTILILSVVYLMIWDFSQIKYLIQSAFPAIVFLFIFFTYPWWIPYIQLSSYNQRGNIYRNTIHGLINDVGISTINESINDSNHWNAYVYYRITNDLVLLYQGKNNFNIYTKGMFIKPNDWGDFSNLIKSKVSNGKNYN